MTDNAIIVRLGADEYTIKPTWKTSMEIAERVGDPLGMAFSVAAGSLELQLKQVVGILWVALKAEGAEYTFDELGELIYKHGPINYTSAVGKYLIEIASQSSEDAPKKKAVKKAKN